MGQGSAAAPGPPVQTKLVPVCVTALYRGCGLVDREGNWNVRPWYSAIYENGEGWTVEKHSGLTGWLDANGNVVIKPQFESLGGFAGGLAPAKLHGQNTKYGYIDASGRWVIQPKFNTAEEFSEGLAGVQWTAGERERSGYVNPQGQMVFSIPEGADQPFVDGRTTVLSRISEHAATVCTGIDRKGRELVRITGQESCSVTVVTGGGWTLQSDSTTRLVDRHLKTLFKVQGEDAYIHGDPEDSPATGLGVFSTGLGEGLIDLRTGQVLLAAHKGQDLGFHGEGRVSYQAEKKGKTVYGFLDYSGRRVIPARYASSDQFRSGRAVVTTIQDTPVVLDRQGQELPRFKALRPVRIELDPWEDDVQSQVRRHVAQVTTEQEEKVWTDLDGRPFLRVRGSQRCTIDEVFNRKGQQIWPADSAAVCRVNEAKFAEHGTLTTAQKALLAQKHAFERDLLNDKARLRAQGSLSVFERMASPEQKRTERLVRNADWQDGPRVISLSPGVRLSLPAGYRYLPPEAVLTLKRRLSDGAESVPEASPGAPLVSTGWLLGPHEHWRTEISVVRRGYMDLGTTLPGDAELLETMKLYTAEELAEGNSSSAFRQLAWLRPPQLETARPRLTYAYTDTNLGVSGGQDILNIALFGRSEVVALSTEWDSLLHFELFQADVLNLSGRIRFLPGHRHQDYQTGDAVAPVPLETLITGPEPEQQSRVRESVAQMEQERQGRINGRLLGLLVALGVAALTLTAQFRRRTPLPSPADPGSSPEGKRLQAQRQKRRKKRRG